MTGSPIDGLASWRHLDLRAVGSTNAEAMALAEEGDPGQLWITAAEQLSGRGRRGRDWSSPPGNLYASALVIDPGPPAHMGSLPLVLAVAVRDAIAALGLPDGVELKIKWPNDILLNGAKCCGLLLESQNLADGRMAVVAGCGINIVSHPEPGLYRATALNREGIGATPAVLFAHLARSFDAALSLWGEGRGLAAIRERWVENARGIGEPITVNLANGRVEGLFEGIDADGVLLLRTGDGTTRRISSGDLFFGNMTGNAGREPGQEQD